MAAWRRYTGVVWSQLDPASLSESQRRRIWVPSAVYGLTTATDAIADHRLSFRARLDGIGSLSAFWRPVLTDLVARRARGRTVIDLLPGEHASALDLEALGERLELIRVRFLQPDGRGAAGHAAKAVKGRVARQIATRGRRRPARLPLGGLAGSCRSRRHRGDRSRAPPGPTERSAVGSGEATAEGRSWAAAPRSVGQGPSEIDHGAAAMTEGREPGAASGKVGVVTIAARNYLASVILLGESLRRVMRTGRSTAVLHRCRRRRARARSQARGPGCRLRGSLAVLTSIPTRSHACGCTTTSPSSPRRSSPPPWPQLESSRGCYLPRSRHRGLRRPRSALAAAAG